MIRPTTSAVLLGIIVVAAACKSHGDTVPDTLKVVLDGAQNLQRQGENVRYSMSGPCPAEPTSEELTARFENAGWIVMDSDPLDSMGHGEHLQKWQPVPFPPGQISAVWIGWFKKENGLANVMLRCQRAEISDDSPVELEVVIRRMTTDDL